MLFNLYIHNPYSLLPSMLHVFPLQRFALHTLQYLLADHPTFQQPADQEMGECLCMTSGKHLCYTLGGAWVLIRLEASGAQNFVIVLVSRKHI